MKITSALAVVLFFSGSVYAAECTTVAEMDAADTAASSIKDWTGVYSFYSHFKQCDDGYIAEGVSATIAGLLANKWNTVEQLEAMADNNKAFGTWAFNHIDTTANDGDLDRILKQSRENCPAEHKQFCGKIENAANQALQDLKE